MPCQSRHESCCTDLLLKEANSPFAVMCFMSQKQQSLQVLEWCPRNNPFRAILGTLKVRLWCRSFLHQSDSLNADLYFLNRCHELPVLKVQPLMSQLLQGNQVPKNLNVYPAKLDEASGQIYVKLDWLFLRSQFPHETGKARCLQLSFVKHALIILPCKILCMRFLTCNVWECDAMLWAMHKKFFGDNDYCLAAAFWFRIHCAAHCRHCLYWLVIEWLSVSMHTSSREHFHQAKDLTLQDKCVPICFPDLAKSNQHLGCSLCSQAKPLKCILHQFSFRGLLER